MNKIIELIKKYVKGRPLKVLRGIYRFIMRVYRLLTAPLYYVFRIVPIKDKVVATSFEGKKYGDNPQFIIEKLHALNPDVEIVWLKESRQSYKVPDYVRIVPIENEIRRAYEYTTARVWIHSHRISRTVKKRSGQLFIETWHGGLGIKKLDGDVSKFRADSGLMAQVHNTSDLADLFISNSDHLTRIYRSAFEYKGKIWKCGYPKNDVLLSGNSTVARKVRDYYNLAEDARILLYVPTFRDSFRDNDTDMSVYGIDYERLLPALPVLGVGDWYVFVRFHPFLLNKSEVYSIGGDHIINATRYEDIEELVIGADAVISDYSSCIFDAAIREIPCFTFATDFNEFKVDRGVYYEMEELPFPYARNNDELIHNIETFDNVKYLNDWKAFKEQTGLYETGHASADIAYVINEFIKGNTKPLEEIKSE